MDSSGKLTGALLDFLRTQGQVVVELPEGVLA
jgi:hypothetical protein